MHLMHAHAALGSRLVGADARQDLFAGAGMLAVVPWPAASSQPLLVSIAV
jgi:hypothetical protein